MKHATCILVGALCGVLGWALPVALAKDDAAAAATTRSSGDWKLVWADEFNKDGAPDPANWSYEVGFVRNHESQYYTDNRRENARVKDGKLIIEGRKEKFVNAKYDPKSANWSRSREFAEYTSACLVTLGKRSFQYGRLEMRARLPAGQGVWPAFWLLGDNIKDVGWPKCGELDVMELVWETPLRIYGTIHYANPDTESDKRHVSRGGYVDDKNQPSSDFHVYAVEWGEHAIEFFYDDQKYKSVNIDDLGNGADHPFRHPMYILLNFAIGGGWGGKIDDAIFPQKYEVDYVRWYQKK